MVRTRLNIGCRYSTPVLERPLHPTRSQFKPQPSQTQAPVTPATEPGRRAGGGLTTPILDNLNGNRLATVPKRLEDTLGVGRHFDDQRHAKQFFSERANINEAMEDIVRSLLPPFDP